MNKKLNIQFINKKLGFRNYILILMNIFSFETRNNFRLTLQLKDILKEIKPSIVTLSYEGNCWESVFSICKNIQKSKCISVGYQHAGVMNNQTIIGINIKMNLILILLLHQEKAISDTLTNFLKKN